MWKYFNPNPGKLNVGDCTVRSICAVTGLDWHTVHKALCDLSGNLYDMPSADRVWWTLLEQFGFTRKRMIDRCPECYTVADFARDHPRGVYILGPHEHAVAVISGSYWDSWDSGATIPTYYFMRRT